MNKIIEVTKVSFAYEKEIILDDISFFIEKGDFVAVIGENGAGKSTLMNLILHNLKAETGEIKLFGDRIEKDNHYKDIAFISQNSVLNYRNFPTTIEEVVRHHMKYLKIKKNVGEHLQAMGLLEHKKKALSELSGGQLQRVGLLLALIKNAKLIVLDEPTTGIDKKFRLELLKLLKEWKEKGKTILMVTHELHDAKDFVDYVIQVKEKKVYKNEDRKAEDYMRL